MRRMDARRRNASAVRLRFSQSLARRRHRLMDASREDALAYMDFPKEHWPQIASTNPLERLNKEVKRRADVVGIFPNGEAIIRLPAVVA